MGITSNVKRYFAEPLRYFDGGRIPPLRNHGDRRRDYRRLVPGGFRGPIGPGEAEILKPMWFLLAVLPERGEQYCGHIFEHYGRRGGWEAEVRRLFRKVEDLGEARRWDRLARWLLRRRMYAQAQGALENLRAIQYAAWGPTGEIQPGTPVTRWFQGSVRQQIAVAGELKDLPGERVLRSILKSLRTCRRDLPDAPWRPRGVGGVVDYLRSVGAWRGPADLRIVKPDARPPGSDGFFRRLDPAGFGVPSVDP
ncbi:MAG: hypothetical protein HUU15_07610 [Candidatus Brocadiae bacterium]|nr:hypothetical protein [Candidatus Brocadiia bacterium]